MHEPSPVTLHNNHFEADMFNRLRPQASRNPRFSRCVYATLILVLCVTVGASTRATAAAETTDPASNASTTAVVQTDPAEVKAKRAAELGHTGTFAEPPLQTADREAFGPRATGSYSASVDYKSAQDSFLPTILWCGFGLTILVTLVCVWRGSRIETAEGKAVHSFTFKSKIALCFGGLTALFMTLIALNASDKNTNEQYSQRYFNASQESSAVTSQATNALRLRMSAKDFLITNSGEALVRYTGDLDKALAYNDALEDTVKDETHLEVNHSIRSMLDQYAEHFDEVVGVIDERNGIVASQLNPTGARLTALIESIMETAALDGDPAAALAAGVALNDLTQARVAIMKFLRSSDANDARKAIQFLNHGEEALVTLRSEVQDPTRQAWLSEAKQGYAFYAQRVERLIELIDRRNEIVLGHLDVIGPDIAKLSDGLVAQIKDEQSALLAESKQTQKSAANRALLIEVIFVLFVIASSIVLLKSLTKPLSRIIDQFASIVATLDLTQRIEVTRQDEVGQLGNWFNILVKKMHDVILDVRSATEEVASASTEIAASSEQIAAGASEQSQQITQVSSAVEEMSASVVEVARKSADAANSANESGRIATEGGDVVDQTITGMRSINEAVTSSASSVQELGKRGEQIGEVITVINDIADQTNLLALNAAIEAARAGEHGRGFAVVADEVRKLADRTTKATEEIAGSIQAIQEETTVAVDKMNAGTEEVTTGVEKAELAGDSLKQIVASAQDVSAMVQSIAAAAEEQSAASEEVSRNIEQIASVTRETSEGTKQSAAACTALSNQAETLRSLLQQFTTREDKRSLSSSGEAPN
jgi:methyl-accepting chemotaxis protein